MAAPTYVSTASHDTVLGAAPLPAGAAVGDVLLVQAVTVGLSPATITAPDGDWQLLLDRDSSHLGIYPRRDAIYARKLKSGEGGATFNWSGSGEFGTAVYTSAYRGDFGADFVADAQLAVESGTAATVTFPSVTATTDNLVVYMGQASSGLGEEGDWPVTVPAGTTLRYSEGYLGIATSTPSAGATGTKSAPIGPGDGSYDAFIGGVIALAPDSGGGGGISGSASLTETADTSAGTGALRLKGSASIAEAGDTSTASGKLALKATASITDAPDTLVATGEGAEPAIEAVASLTEDGDTASAAAALLIQGSTVRTEDGDTAAATATLALTASLSATEADDGVSAAGALAVAAQADLTEDGDALTATAELTSGIAATASITEADDAASVSGALALKASASITETDDGLDAAGTSAGPVIGQAIIFEMADIIVALGKGPPWTPADRTPETWAPTSGAAETWSPVGDTPEIWS